MWLKADSDEKCFQEAPEGETLGERRRKNGIKKKKYWLLRRPEDIDSN